MSPLNRLLIFALVASVGVGLVSAAPAPCRPVLGSPLPPHCVPGHLAGHKAARSRLDPTDGPVIIDFQTKCILVNFEGLSGYFGADTDGVLGPVTISPTTNLFPYSDALNPPGSINAHGEPSPTHLGVLFDAVNISFADGCANVSFSALYVVSPVEYKFYDAQDNLLGTANLGVLDNPTAGCGNYAPFGDLIFCHWEVISFFSSGAPIARIEIPQVSGGTGIDDVRCGCVSPVANPDTKTIGSECTDATIQGQKRLCLDFDDALGSTCTA